MHFLNFLAFIIKAFFQNEKSLLKAKKFKKCIFLTWQILSQIPKWSIFSPFLTPFFFTFTGKYSGFRKFFVQQSCTWTTHIFGTKIFLKHAVLPVKVKKKGVKKGPKNGPFWDFRKILVFFKNLKNAKFASI